MCVCVWSGGVGGDASLCVLMGEYQERVIEKSKGGNGRLEGKGKEVKNEKGREGREGM